VLLTATMTMAMVISVQGQAGRTPALRPADVAMAVRVKGDAPTLDGHLADPAWRDAPVLGGLIQRDPDEGSPASERTEVRLLYTDSYFYIGVRAFDSEASRITAPLARRDEDVPSDWIGIQIDSYHDRRTAFEFAVNPAGVRKDIYRFNDTEEDWSWNPVWEVATNRDGDGWTAEFRIPWTQLRFAGEGQDEIGFNVYRTINRKNEMSYWRPLPRNTTGVVSRFGDLAGLADLHRGRRLEIEPYVLGRTDLRPASNNPFDSGTDVTGTIGGDLRATLTSRLNLTATINPDFGQVDADPAVVNLGPFESFFEERRPFFTEGVELFNFSMDRSDVSSEQLFYSRRIGRTPQRPANPEGGYAESVASTRILGAVKLTGKSAGGWSVGLLSALTAEEHARTRAADGALGEAVVEPRTGYVVGRVARELRNGQTVLGAFGTLVNRHETPATMGLRSAAYAAGLDLTHRFSHDTYRARARVAASRVTGSTEAILATQRSSVHYLQRPDIGFATLDSARTSLSGLHADAAFGKYSGGAFLWDLSAETRTPGFETNDAGFQSWAGETWAQAKVRYRWLTPGKVFRRVELTSNAIRGWTYDGDRINGAHALIADVVLPSYWGISGEVWHRLGGIDPRATRGGPAIRQTGNVYAWGEVRSDDRRALRGRLAVSGWDYYGSDRTDIRLAGGLTWRASPRQEFSIEPSFEREVDDLQYLATADIGGRPEYFIGKIRLTTAALQLRGNFTFTPDLTLQLYAEPFISSGEYVEYRRVVAPRARPYDAQFERLADDQILRGADGRVAFDLDRDGTPDADAGQPNFTTLSFRSNTVLRWEYLPGSTAFLVWQHNRSRNTPDGRFDLGGGVRDLFSGAGRNTLLLKLSYWMNLD